MSIKLLADENFPRYAVDALCQKGYDVAWIRTDSLGIKDEQVLERAIDEERLRQQPISRPKMRTLQTPKEI